MTNPFRDALDEWSSDHSFYAQLVRGSLVAGEASFYPEDAELPSLALKVGQRAEPIAAHDSYILTKALQDATTKLGRIIRDPKTEYAGALASDRRRATLLLDHQYDNILVFSFPKPTITQTALPSTRSPGLTELAVRELVELLPASFEDTSSLRAALAQRKPVRSALSSIANAVKQVTAPIQLSYATESPSALESVLSIDQATRLSTELLQKRTERRRFSVTGRLDGLRTKRRLFFLETESGQEIQGGMESTQVPAVIENLDKRVVVSLEEQVVENLAGQRSRPLYLLLSVTPAGEVYD